MLDARDVLDLAKSCSNLDQGLRRMLQSEQESGRTLQSADIGALIDPIRKTMALVRPLRFLADWDRFKADQEAKKTQKEEKVDDPLV